MSVPPLFWALTSEGLGPLLRLMAFKTATTRRAEAAPCSAYAHCQLTSTFDVLGSKAHSPAANPYRPVVPATLKAATRPRKGTHARALHRPKLSAAALERLSLLLLLPLQLAWLTCTAFRLARLLPAIV